MLFPTLRPISTNSKPGQTFSMCLPYGYHPSVSQEIPPWMVKSGPPKARATSYPAWMSRPAQEAATPAVTPDGEVFLKEFQIKSRWSATDLFL